MMKNTLTKLSVVALTLGLVTGCATTDQLTQMQADITKHRRPLMRQWRLPTLPVPQLPQLSVKPLPL